MRRGAIIAAAWAAFMGSAAPVHAETFTSAQFLEWPQESQRFYFRAAIGMAGVIVRQNDISQADCIDTWYFADEAAAEMHVRSIMKTYPSYHPLGILVAVLEKRCGVLRYAER